LIEKAYTNEGTTIIVDSTAATEVAAVGIWYYFGSRDEDESLQGSTHFIEHMLFKGTSSRSPFQIARGIDRLGGQINAATERECVYFFSSVPLESFDYVAEILIDIICDASFKHEDFEKEKIVIENELVAAEDDPEEHAVESFYERLWGNHALARRIGGTVPLLDNLNHEEVWKMYCNQYKSCPPLVTIAGDISIDKAQKIFYDRFRKPFDIIKRIKPDIPFLGAPYYKPASHQHIQIFCSFIKDFDISVSDYYALLIANTVLGDSMSSRLFQSLREQLGLCYNINSVPSFFSDITEWTVYATITHESITKFIDALAYELYSIYEHGLTENEIQDARCHLIGSMKFDALDIEYRMHRLAHQWLSDYDPISMMESVALLNSLTIEEINSIIKRFMCGGAIIFGVGPTRSKSLFCRAAKKLVSIF